jgi:hypothetical protein
LAGVLRAEGNKPFLVELSRVRKQPRQARLEGNSTLNWQDLAHDCVSIIDFLRKDKNVTKLGIHGHSLGGVVGILAAQKRELDFFYSDRSLYSLNEMALSWAGRIAQVIFQLFFNECDDFNKAYLELKCYKVIGVDVRDSVIDYNCSMACGVSLGFA